VRDAFGDGGRGKGSEDNRQALNEKTQENLGRTVF